MKILATVIKTTMQTKTVNQKRMKNNKKRLKKIKKVITQKLTKKLK